MQANIDTNMSVQLYEYSTTHKDVSSPAAPGVLENFKVICNDQQIRPYYIRRKLYLAQEGKRKPYPSTLRVRVSATPRPDKRTPVTRRPLHVLEQEVRPLLVFLSNIARDTKMSRHFATEQNLYRRLASRRTSK